MAIKTAVSVDDNLLRQADEAARQMGLSRSRLFAVAISEFLRRKKQEEMLLQLNEAYGEGMIPAEKRLLKGMKAKARRIAESK
jgi:metal-responsive CopG/Arc/MetJ family transcriptional regulator